jgi:diaminohydroxyphosphoribosylaminopyrimidine deaminase/5-amino-6-(5-phosphoribosylamino)uracil reductase
VGIQVNQIEDKTCEDLLCGFKVHLKKRYPHILLKWAMTLDGRIAAKDGSSKWISGEYSRRAVHKLRGHVDAVMVGNRTVILDDPSLNARWKGSPLVPVRVVMDPSLKIPLSARLFKNPGKGIDPEGFPLGPVWILAGRDAEGSRTEAFKKTGAEVFLLDSQEKEKGPFLMEALSALRERGIQRLLVEGGGTLFTSFIEARLADQVVAFIAPKIVGGRSAPSPIEGSGRVSMEEAFSLVDVKIKPSGQDAQVKGFIQWHGSS